MQLAPPTHTLLSQTWSLRQVPQSSIPKQPLPIVPQYRPLGGSHVTDGVQTPASVWIDRSGEGGFVSVTTGASVPLLAAVPVPPPWGCCCDGVGVTPAQPAAPSAATTRTVRTRGCRDMVVSLLSGR